MELDTLLSELQKRFGFSGLNADKNGVYSIQINNKFILNLANSNDQSAFYLYSDILKLNPDPQAKLLVYERLLGANLFGKETHGSFFAFDTARGVVLLMKRFDKRLVDFGVFFEEFRDFINGLGYWDKVVAEKELDPSKAGQGKQSRGNPLMDLGRMV